jgi:Calcineurin-like phosphoesterase
MTKRWDGGLQRREFIQTAGLGALGLGLVPWGCGDGDPPAGPADGGQLPDANNHKPFSIVALPDTQNYAESYPSVFDDQAKWIVDNATTERIAFVTHLGDIVDNGPDLDQWSNARKSMGLLEQAGVPYGVCLGNHDLQYNNAKYQYPTTIDRSCTKFTQLDCSAQHYLENFGPKRFAGKSWFGGGSPSGLSTYQKISIEGIELLFLHICLDQRKGELTWAQQVLDKHPGALVHVSTHRYMYDFRLVKGLPYPLSTLLGGRYTDAHYGFDDKLYFNDAVTAGAFFSTFVAKNPNIFMVQCGHFDAEYHTTSKNSSGLPVHEILVDFQTFSPQGGDGWLRLLNFDLDRGEIRVRTYSPTLKRFRQNGDGFDASVQALKAGLNAYRDLFKMILDFDALEKQADYWGTDPKGRKEYHGLLYGGGERDSDFTLKVDFAAFLAQAKQAA